MNNLHLSPEAQNDLTEIQQYIAEELENQIAAANTVKKIIKGIRALLTHAELGAPLSSIADVESDYRFLVSGSYLTFYRTYGSEVYVDRILYGRRDYLRILFGDVLEEDKTE